MTTTTLPRLADQAVAARAGADLYRFALGDRIPDTAFASNSDGSVTVTGIDFLKSGTFNGLGLVDADLEAMVQHYTALRDAGIFLPPFRLDHSWSVLSVIGWVDNLETYRRVDETDSMEKTFLRGDVRLTGSIDYTPAQIVKAIKGGSLRNRSSELGYYVTNAGVELPLVFYGCAFVDIPAVEGLGAVALRSVVRSTPHSIVNLTTEGRSTMDPEKLARLTALRAQSELSADEEVERDELEAEEAAHVTAPAPDASVDADGVEESADDTPDEDASDNSDDTGDADEEEDADDPADETPAGETVDAPAGAPANEVEALRAEIARLRDAEATRELERFQRGGVIVQANEEAATFLLRHDDEEVRRRVGVLLSNLPAGVTLSRPRGKVGLSTESNGSGAGGQLIKLGMTAAEVGPLWASLTPEERTKRNGEYLAWRKDRDENGIRD